MESVSSNARFDGYGLWVLPERGSSCETTCLSLIERFSRRFPPLQLPVWTIPHISIVAGCANPEPLVKVAETLALELEPFGIDLSGGAEVDSDRPGLYRNIYFPTQRLRACWIHSAVGQRNEHGEDRLGAICRRSRELLGEETSTKAFQPHLSLVYFDCDELDEEQRQQCKVEVDEAFPNDALWETDEIVLARTTGKPAEWEVLQRFPLKKRT